MSALAVLAATVPEVTAPSIDWPALVPLLFLVGGAVLLLTIASLVRPPAWFLTAWTVAAGLGCGIAAIPVWVRVHGNHGPYSTLATSVSVDAFGMFLTVVIAASVVFAALTMHDYLGREGLVTAEWYVLLLLSASGGVVMAMANDLLLIFLGLEVLSIAVYVLAAMHSRRIQSQEAGLKYFVLGAFSSGFLLYGIALLYGATGSTNFVDITNFLARNVVEKDGMLLLGLGLLLIGLAFKVAAVPFHAWQPDVYQGSPTPVVAYMASGVKAAGFAALLRVFVVVFGVYHADWQPAVYTLAVLTLLVGALLAIVQRDVKRMLAYSSISHAGFMLVGLQAATDKGISATLFYLAAYLFMVAGSFGVVSLVGRKGDRRHSIDDYRGLGSQRPVLAFAFTVFLLAQAGVPFTAGFFAKFYVIQAAVDARSFWLALTAMVSSVIAAFLYLRVVAAMYTGEPKAGDERIAIPVTAGVAIGIALVATVFFGFFPSLIEQLARDAQPVVTAVTG